MKATEQYFPVLLFIMVHKVILTFEFLKEILKSDHLNETLLLDKQQLLLIPFNKVMFIVVCKVHWF